MEAENLIEATTENKENNESEVEMWSEVGVRGPWSSVYQGKPTHALQRGVNKRVLATAQVNRLGRGEIEVGGATLFIEQFRQAREKLKPSAVKLFYAGVRELARKNSYKGTPIEKIQYSVSFSLSDYMKLRGIHDRREARRQVKSDCEILLSFSVKWEENRGKNTISFKMMNFFGGAELENGIITLKFNPEFAEYLINKAFEMKLPKNCNHRKTRNPFIYAGLRLIYHDIVYIFYHCHMLPF